MELPSACAGLHYSNIVCGAITGALRMVHLAVECSFTADELKGAQDSEIRVRLVSVLKDNYKDEEE